jgi:hypothetical protein
MRLAVGARLEIRGRFFRPGLCKNTVVFQRRGGKAVFVRADLGTRKLLKVTLPARLEKQLLVREGFAVPTRFRLRVLVNRFGKGFTRNARSPVIGPTPPPAPPGTAPATAARSRTSTPTATASSTPATRTTTTTCSPTRSSGPSTRSRG